MRYGGVKEGKGKWWGGLLVRKYGVLGNVWISYGRVVGRLGYVSEGLGSGEGRRKVVCGGVGVGCVKDGGRVECEGG